MNDFSACTNGGKIEGYDYANDWVIFFDVFNSIQAGNNSGGVFEGNIVCSFSQQTFNNTYPANTSQTFTAKINFKFNW